MEECLEQLPLQCTAASPQSSEEATKPPWVAPQLCALGVVAMDLPSVSAHVHAHNFRTCWSPSAWSSPVLVVHRWPHLSSRVLQAQLCGLQPLSTAGRTRSPEAPSLLTHLPPRMAMSSGGPSWCSHTPSHGRERRWLTGDRPGQALPLCRSGCDCAATVREACRESYSFSYASGTARLSLGFDLTTTGRTERLSDLMLYLN